MSSEALSTACDARDARNPVYCCSLLIGWLFSCSKTLSRCYLNKKPRQYPVHQQAVSGAPAGSAAWHMLVDKQRLLCFTSRSADDFGLHHPSSKSFRLPRIGKWQRPSKPGQPGFSRTLVEQLFKVCYLQMQPSRSKQASLFSWFVRF